MTYQLERIVPVPVPASSRPGRGRPPGGRRIVSVREDTHAADRQWRLRASPHSPGTRPPLRRPRASYEIVPRPSKPAAACRSRNEWQRGQAASTSHCQRSEGRSSQRAGCRFADIGRALGHTILRRPASTSTSTPIIAAGIRLYATLVAGSQWSMTPAEADGSQEWADKAEQRSAMPSLSLLRIGSDGWGVGGLDGNGARFRPRAGRDVGRSACALEASVLVSSTPECIHTRGRKDRCPGEADT